MPLQTVLTFGAYNSKMYFNVLLNVNGLDGNPDIPVKKLCAKNRIGEFICPK